MSTTGHTAEATTDDRPLRRVVTVDRLLVGAATLPFVAAAVALVVGVGDGYLPVSDQALAEMLVRDVGHHPVLIGLYSRDDWSHPGPLLYYLLAPFYWATGNASIGLNLGALAINGASVLGMGLVARRRAGTAAMAATFAACALLLRTLGAEFAHDAWNCFVTVLPFGLLAFLVWALLSGDRWVLPVAVFVASFLAQTHVGFVALGLPLLGLGVAGLVVTARRGGSDGWWRPLARPVLWATGVGAVVWAPTAVDTATGSPRNLVNIVRWFRHPEEGAHTVGDGLRVMAGQFGIWPEWATRTRSFAFSGESVYIDAPVVPWLLLVVVVAAVVLWLRSPADRPLVVVAATVFALGVAAVARTVGPAFQYRLYWTYVLPLICAVLVALAAWRLAAPRMGTGGRRAVAALGVSGLLALTSVNVVSGARAGMPAEGHTGVMEVLTPQVLAALGDVDGPVLVSDPFFSGTWYARGLVLQLEKHGIDARVPPERTYEAAEHRVHRGGPLAARLIVMRDASVAAADDPGLRLVADWTSAGLDRVLAVEREVAAIRADVDAGRLSPADGAARIRLIEVPLREAKDTVAYRVGVFLVPLPGG